MSGYAVIYEQKARQAEQAYRAGNLYPEPYRITMALEMRSLYGPEVDEKCLTAEPAVDLWEKGLAAPTWEQLEALAELTEMPVLFFLPDPFEVARDAEPRNGFFICGRAGCEPFEPLVRPERFGLDMAPVIPMRRRGEGGKP